MPSIHALRAFALATIAGAALAQSPTLVLRVGDAIPGAGKITDIEAVEISSFGQWQALVHTDDPVAHTVLYAYGAPHVKAGDSPASLGGASLAAPTWDGLQFPAYIARLGGSVLVDIEAGPRSYSVDPLHGRFVVFVGSLADGTRGVCVLDQGAIEVYCTGKTNSLGVQPVIYWSGQPPSATAGSGFEIKAGTLLANQPAHFFYGLDGPLAMPFHGGTLCVQPPLQRGPLVDTGGGTGVTGNASMDFNAWIASGVDPRLVAGARVHVQLWYRDPGFAPPDDVGLTPGLTFQIAQ